MTGENPRLDAPEITQRAGISEDHADDGDGRIGVRRIGGVGAVPGASTIRDKPTEGADNPDGNKTEGVCEPGIPVRGLVLAGDDALEAVKPGLLMPYGVPPMRPW